MLETFLRDFGPYWHESMTQLLLICRLHIHDANLPFHRIPKCSIGLRSGDCGGHLSKVNSLSCYNKYKLSSDELYLSHTQFTSKWSSGQPTLRRPGSSWGFGALLKGLTSVVDTSCQSRDSNPQPWVTSGFKSNALSIRPRLKPVWYDLSFVTWCIILLEVVIRRWVHCNHKGMDMVSNNTEVGCGV